LNAPLAPQVSPSPASTRRSPRWQNNTGFDRHRQPAATEKLSNLRVLARNTDGATLRHLIARNFVYDRFAFGHLARLSLGFPPCRFESRKSSERLTTVHSPIHIHPRESISTCKILLPTTKLTAAEA